MTNQLADMLHIGRRIGDDQRWHYQCRGMGESYAKFYEWCRSSSYRCTSEDWPWDYFVFDNEADDNEIVIKFGTHLHDER